MDVAQLLEPVVAGGIKDTHFFNGRILTADDLRTMQAAARQHDAQLARAIGDGVAYGLEVSLAQGSATSGSQAVLHIERGLALNLSGERAALSSAVDVALVQSLNTPVSDDVFVVCEPPTDGEFTNLGLYLLTIAPASDLAGHAAMTTLSSDGIGSKCGSRYEVEGVKFDMRALALPAGDGSARVEARNLFSSLQTTLETLGSGPLPPAMFKLRNIVAHLFFGSDIEDQYALDPLAASSAPVGPGWLEQLRSQRLLSDCEVPLALLYWSKRGIEFIDMWAVRRRPAVPVAPQRSLPWLIAARSVATAEARLLQFQNHVEDLRKSLSDPSVGVASDYFRYLPAAGLLPLGGTFTKGFNLLTFFSTTTTRQQAPVIEGARLQMFLRQSLQYPAIDTESEELVWLYLVAGNQQAYDQSPTAGVQRYAVFARGDLPYVGNAHFDVAHWNYGSFSMGCGPSGFVAV